MNRFPLFPVDRIPLLTTDQMIEVDRLMIEVYKIELIQMMENAGRNLARLAVERFLDQAPQGGRVSVLAGRGGNGGGAIVAARRLHAWGARVELFVSSPKSDYSGVPGHQLEIASKMGIPVIEDELPTPNCDLILDGVIGYSLRGAPRGRAADLIQTANESETPTLALDVPSGLDAAKGDIHQPCITANATLTLALPKKGLLESQALRHVGELYLGDISVPPSLYKKMEINVPSLFANSDIVQIQPEQR